MFFFHTKSLTMKKPFLFTREGVPVLVWAIVAFIAILLMILIPIICKP